MSIKTRTISSLCLLASVFIFGLASCNSGMNASIKNEQFVSMFPDFKMNEYLKLQAVKNGPVPPVTNEDTVTIEVVNISNEQIIIRLDLPHQNYIYDEAKGVWTLIPEMTDYQTIRTITLFPKTDLEKEQFKDWADFIEPDLSQYKKPIVVRILFLGEIAQDGESTGQKVGSYIDITFKP